MDFNVDIQEVITNVSNWLTTKGLLIAVVIIAAEVVNHFIKMLISRAVDRLLAKRSYPTKQDRKQRAQTLTRMFSTGARIGVWTFAVVVVAVQLGADIGAIVAGAGFLGLAFGIGAQSLIKDVLTGIFIVIENQYRVGDIVELNDQSGEVVDITMRITQLRDIDGNAHFIPNGQITHAINKSIGFSKINLLVNVAYDTNVDKVEKIINETARKLQARPEFGKYIVETPYFARVDGFGDSGMQIRIFGIVKPGKQWDVSGEFRRMLKTEFDKAGIEIPYPQLVIRNTKN